MVQSVSPRQGFEALLTDPEAQLVDVRTDAEWQYVGIPDLREAGKRAVLISWQYFPTGNVNARFAEELRDAGIAADAKLYFLCRSGVRSQAAAEAAEAAGFTRCFNVAEGFEGHPDQEGHRGTLDGWKAAGLPWRQ